MGNHSIGENVNRASQTSSSSLVESSTTAKSEFTWKIARRTFLERYNDDIKSYHALSKVVEDLCSQLVRGKGIRHQISSRVKDPQSFKIKVDKAISTSMAQRSKTTNIKPIANENEALVTLDEAIRDRAGVRILVYFPEDVSKVAEVIKTCNEIEDMGAVVSYTKSRQDHREHDKAEQQKGGPLNYSDGPWISYAAVPTEEVIQRWKHSGYRAAHVHVRLRLEFKSESDRTDVHTGKCSVVQRQENAVDLDNAPTGISALEIAEMLRAIYQEKPLSELDPVSKVEALDSRLSEVYFHDLQGKQAEIQITTVVMHAWSQVEHDITYKMPPEMLHSRAVDRMLDGINGLSITTEIMLEELERNLKDAEIECDKNDREKKFYSVEQLESWINSAYLRDTSRLDWEATPRWISPLFMILSHVPFGNPCRYHLKQCLAPPKHLKVPQRDSEKQDISLLLLRALGALPKWTDRDICRHIYPDQFLDTWLFNQLLVAITFDFMVSLEDWDRAVERVQQKFPVDFDKINKIRAIFEELQTDMDEIECLGDFSTNFLMANWCPTHDLAVTLSGFCWLPASYNACLYTIADPPSFADYWRSYSSNQTEVEGFSVLLKLAMFISRGGKGGLDTPISVATFNVADGSSENNKIALHVAKFALESYVHYVATRLNHFRDE